MNSWIRVAAGALVAATLALGLSSSSAGAADAGSANSTATGGDRSRPAATAAIPDENTELLYQPLTPCRIADTRTGGGLLQSDVPRAFAVTGTDGFPQQGGVPGGCGVPPGASSVTANVTTTAATAAGYLVNYPFGAAAPTTNFTSYHIGDTATANPSLTLAVGAAQPAVIMAHGGKVQVIIDVTGYYIPPIQARILLDGSVGKGTSRVLDAGHPGTGVYTVTIDRDVTTCTVNSNADGSGAYFINAVGNGTTVTAYAYNSSGSPIDLNWQLHVTC